MALTDDEQRRLDRITRTMQWDDPALERALSTGRFGHSRGYAIGTGTAVAAAGALFVALWLEQGVLILAAWVLLVVGTVVRTVTD